MSDLADGTGGWREAVLSVLEDACEWQLPAERWAGIAPILQDLSDALDAGEAGAAEDAAYQLNLVGAVRIARIGAPLPSLRRLPCASGLTS